MSPFRTHLLGAAIFLRHSVHILVMNDEFCPLGFTLHCFHRVDILWDTFGVAEEVFHHLSNIHRIDSVYSQTELGEMIDYFEGRDVYVKRIKVLELLVPRFVNDFHDEVLACIIGCFVELTVISLGFVFFLPLGELQFL